MNLIAKHNAGIFLKHIFIVLLICTLMLLQMPMSEFHKSQAIIRHLKMH